MTRLGLSFVALSGTVLLSAACLQDFEQFRGEGGSGGSPTTTSTVTSTVTTGMTCDPATCPGTIADCSSPNCVNNGCAVVNSPMGTPCDDGPADTKVCNGSGLCVECNSPADCTDPATPECQDNVCVAEHCQNTVQDADETDINCGGDVCPPCMNNQGCMDPVDCQSGYCMGTTCTACTANDNCDTATQWCDDETNGGTCTAKKPNGETCDEGFECTSANCTDGVCCGDALCPDCQSCNIGGMEGACANDPVNTPCDDSTFCNGADTCDGNGSCNVHAGDPCPGPDGDNDCSETCNEGAGDCSGNDANNSACNDGQFCNGADTCNSSGSCANHAGNPCPGHNVGPACNDSCNESSDMCNGSDSNGTACPNANFCDGAETCNGSGACVSPGNPCPGHNVGDSCDDSCDETDNDCMGSDASGTACDENGAGGPQGTCNSSGTCMGD